VLAVLEYLETVKQADGSSVLERRIGVPDPE